MITLIEPFPTWSIKTELLNSFSFIKKKVSEDSQKDTWNLEKLQSKLHSEN